MKAIPMAIDSLGPSVVINAPDLFKQPEFIAWLNDPSIGKFTWHTPGQTPATEYSDVIVLVDPGLEEGTNDEMPGWDSLMSTLRAQFEPGHFDTHITVRLTNLS